MAQNWGTGSSVGVVTGTSIGARDTSAARIVDPQLEWAQNFLSIAITQTEKDMVKNPALSATLVELLIRHADILERINTRDSLLESRTRFERAWVGLGARGLAAARVASKLGDLNFRLGESNDAVAWWKRALELLQPENQTIQSTPLPNVPLSLPESPFAQRIMASTMVSLSGHLATSAKDLKGALSIQQRALALLESPEPSGSRSPAQTLHSLFLVHRSSLLSIQQGEVLFALRNPAERSIQVLSSAANDSERVISALSQPHAKPTIKNIQDSLLPAFGESRTLSKPAKALLRDARRSAADAWNLIGILSEPTDKFKALDCYQRAIKAIGVCDAASGEYTGPKDGIPDAEWVSTKKNHERLTHSIIRK
jgi:tetratricopeptide (TPR) repeat protein